MNALLYLFLYCGYRNEREAIEVYFRRGHQYKVILLFLTLYHAISMSIRMLKRRIAGYGLSRRAVSPMATIWNAINQELQGPSIFIL